MTRTIVCYGDSNTHGADPDPAVRARLPRDVRWPGIMRAALGDGDEVIEEGLGGRCTVWDSPLAPGRNALAYLGPCLASHEPVDGFFVAAALARPGDEIGDFEQRRRAPGSEAAPVGPPRRRRLKASQVFGA